ncbi:MAG: DsbA family oxidoreductase [Burkholderiales bacterium]|jgi:predicted DsbA family dithiol-disulfide isomerase|nr:DsbA family oxidoreductase [Burkholderiales bacterium]
MPLTIDVISDVVCPWCWIGKRRLDAALAQWNATASDGPAVVRWHPFQLAPDLPRGGTDRRAYLEAKFGGPERTREIYARVEAAGREVGLPFAFDRIARQPNTRQAHRLLAWAATQSATDRVPAAQHALAEALFGGWFVDGADYSDDAALARQAAAAGLDGDAAAAFLATDQLDDVVADGLDAAHRIGVSGVPFFIFDGRLAVSGAQPSDVLVDAMRQAHSDAIGRADA